MEPLIFTEPWRKSTLRKILPVFEKRFPGIKVNHVDATADKLAARAITEARGGRVYRRCFSEGPWKTALQLQQQGLLLEQTLPEAAPYPDTLKGSTLDRE